MAGARHHTHAAVIATGDELALGQALNTNSMWIADRLWAAGVEVVEHVTIGDDREALAGAIRRLAMRAPLVVVTGGLGPTLDDVTREALADVLREDLVVDQRALDRLEARYRARGRELPEIQRGQAMRPRSAVCLDNDQGTAPGLYVALPGAGPGDESDVFCLPGPPAEMKPIVERELIPRLRHEPGWRVRTRFLHTAVSARGTPRRSLAIFCVEGRIRLWGSRRPERY